MCACVRACVYTSVCVRLASGSITCPFTDHAHRKRLRLCPRLYKEVTEATVIVNASCQNISKRKYH